MQKEILKETKETEYLSNFFFAFANLNKQTLSGGMNRKSWFWTLNFLEFSMAQLEAQLLLKKTSIEVLLYLNEVIATGT